MAFNLTLTPLMDELQFIEKLSRELGGELVKGRIWKIEGTKKGIPYIITQRTFADDKYDPFPKSISSKILTTRGLCISVPLKTKKEFDVFGSIGIYETVKTIHGIKVENEISISGKDTNYGKDFLERNKKEIAELAGIVQPPVIKHLTPMLRVKNGEMKIIISYGDLLDQARSAHQSKRYKSLSLALNLLITIAKRES